ncbi:tetratricopeptide repeat protein [Chlorobium sp. KB01]|uniref:tetratricopeptide repeat protein n=1 Tax=Chlorobium sp. KB01 TaxID=1917528 RepID=UPI0009780E21|nr:tetratricopeptide repeat protein [Chlorobium sp. KB01]
MSGSVQFSTAILLLTLLLTAAVPAAGPLTAEEYYLSGKAKYHLKDYTGAIEDYNRAAELAPDIAKIFGSRGAAKRKLGDKRAAIADAQQAARLGDRQARRILRFPGYEW